MKMKAIKSKRLSRSTKSFGHSGSRRLFHETFESLEQRRLFSLLGITPGYPQIGTDQAGTVNYTYDNVNSIGSFDLSALPLNFVSSSGATSLSILNSASVPATFQIHFKTDGSGGVTGGVAGADFSITGTIDVNHDRKVDAGDISGTLLTGEIEQLGYNYTGSGTNQFDFRFQTTDGLLLTTYASSFQNQDIGVTMSSEQSTFNGSFKQNFTGMVKAVVGPIPSVSNAPPVAVVSTTIDDLTGSAPTQTLGEFVYDTSLVSGSGPTPTGTVTYNFYNTSAPAYGTTSPLFSQSVNLNLDGTVPASPITGPLGAGSYSYIAVYSGDSNYGIAIGDPEPLTINTSTSSVSTNIQDSTGGPVTSTLGESVYDTATVTGTPITPTGTVTYNFYNTSSPTYGVTAPVSTQTVSLNPDGTLPTSSDTSPLSAGNYSFIAVYSGDANYTSSVGAIEPLGINKGTLSLITEIHDAQTGNAPTGATGESVYDTYALVGDQPLPFTGTVTYTFNSAAAGSGLQSDIEGPLGAGNYFFQASSFGDDNYNIIPAALEPLVINPANPAINTVAGNTVVIGSGDKLTDTAVLSGGYLPTGTITFTLTGPGNTTLDTEFVSVNGDNTYSTPGGYLPTVAGSYIWSATYNGDTNNTSASDNGVNESEAVSPATPAINTNATVSNGGVVGVAVLQDQATLSGGYNPTGTITFTLTQPDNTIITFSPITANGDNTYFSPTVLATEVGNYTWHATYSGDTNNTGASDNGANEGVTTTQSSPAINTVAGNTVVIGSGDTLSDTAVLSGGFNPTGIITFTLRGPANTVLDTETVPVSGDNTYSTPTGYLPTVAGNYVWSATYSGDTNNTSATDNGQNESQAVSPSNPAINTVALGTVIIGSGAKLGDTANLTGGFSPTGTITFTLYNSAHTALYTDVVTVSGDGSYNTSIGTNPGGYLPTIVGAYLWTAIYSGDTNNTSATDNGQNESEAVSPNSPAINTQATVSNGGIVGIAVLQDQATLSGGYNPTGTITFTLTQPDSTTITVGSVPANGDNTYTSPTIIATEVGNYIWHAVYSGDTNNSGAQDNGANEGVTTTQSSPAINTQATVTNNGVIGAAVLQDKATLSGGYSPTGTIVFTLTKPDNTTITIGTVTAAGDGIYTSPTYNATMVGNYLWHATYSGDTNNAGAVDNGVNEGVITAKSTPAITTTASFKSGTGSTVGSAVAEDSAVLSGGYSPTGTITFTLKGPTGATVSTQTVNITGDGTYTTTNTQIATATGTYTWTAVYNGDANNISVTDQGGAAEQLTPTKSSPAITTAASKSGTGACGTTTITDSAVVASGYNPTGTITFTLTDPTGATISTQNVTINGDGTYSPAAVATTKVGTYTWHATYNGDTNNNTAVDQGGAAEQVTIGKNAPTVVTTASTKSGTGNVIGAAIPEDAAIISGGYNPTGTITFTLKGPTGATVTTQTVNVTGDGTYSTTNSAVATSAGTYTWSAAYNGDTNNSAANDQGGAAEQITVTKASPSVVTSAYLKTGCTNFIGNGIPEDSAVFSAGYNATGSLTFKLTAPNGSVIDTEVVAVHGNGTYTTSNNTAATLTGTYSWNVTYAGDTNNNTAVDQGGAAEKIVIGAGSISGTKFNDITGNGLSDDDTPLSGVTIQLLKSGSSTVIASDVTDSSGNYSFDNLAAGTYVVRESVPTGWVQTGPVAGTYTITINSSTPVSTGDDFSDFMSSCCNTSDFSCVTFCIQDASGVKTVSDLRGNTNQGDEVTAFFNYTGSTPHPVTLVTYTAPDNYYNANDASDQKVFQIVTIMAQPGENSISVQIPNCDYQIDLVCGYAIDQLGPAGSNIFYSAQNRLISADNDGSQAQASTFGQINGSVYLDLDNDGNQDSNETGIAGVIVQLTGKDSHNTAVSLLRVTDSNGDYSFQGLQPGTYSVKEVSPSGLIDGKDTLGTGAGGTVSNDLFSNLKIVSNTDGENYNFGERPGTVCSGVSGKTATCTFWNGSNGKNLLCSLGGSSSDCSLGNWLASCFPNLYGSSCGSNSLAGKSNSQCYSYFQNLYKNSSSKSACTVLAACFNIYCTDSSLSGTCAAQYGFQVGSHNAVCTTYSVGSNGSCFNVSNNSKCSLQDLVDGCNDKSSKGSLYSGNTTLSNSCYTALSSICGW
ncbi:MAG TPA: SdrD B-like domain-containing protein [Tepidisphaeraceae bacterium]|jgi:hypothetical protein|nr:SdrD B-like domain-containing protein [Tepidisphaeraceae bacterium]